MEEDDKRGRTRDLFKKVKQITGKCSANIDGIKDKSGTLLTEDDDIKDRWRQYTEELYERDKEMTEVYVVDEECELEPCIMRDEVRHALKSLANDKAPGCDDIPIELLKAAGEEAITAITELCNKIWVTGKWPNDWIKLTYITIPKKGDARECNNNRTISLISHASKIMLKIIQARLEPYVKAELPDEQAGFRKGRGTRDQIANVRWIMEREHEYGRNVYFCFIDYSKAFDSVDHNKLWNVMQKMGVPKHLINLLHNLYVNQVAVVRTACGETSEFSIGKGVRQGCILSPMLFNLYDESIMREAGLSHLDAGIKIGGLCLNNLRYADDTTLAASLTEDLKNIIRAVKKASEEYGLYLNIGKTKVLSSVPLSSFEVDGMDIEVVHSFNFLGSTISDDGDCSKEIIRRTILGKVAMKGLQRVWKDRDISLATKVRLVKSLVFPVVCYSCESWTMKAKDRRRIEAFENWCWRRLLRIPWSAKRTNESIRNELQINEHIEHKMSELKLRYFGHVVRANGLEKTIMFGMGEGQRRRGRPRIRWLDEIVALTGKKLEELMVLTEDRAVWRSFASTATRGRPRPDGPR